MVDFVKQQIDLITGAGYGFGSILAQVSSPSFNLLQIIIQTAIVTLVAFIVKKTVERVYSYLFEKDGAESS